MIVLASARETDRTRIEAMHAACSVDSRIGRWHAPLRAIPTRYLADAVSGHAGHACVLALDGDEVVGFASAVRGSGERWDLGVLVRDDRQRARIGTRLIDEVVRTARARGARALAADLRPDRRFLLAVLGRHGCVVARTDADGIHAEVALRPRSAPTEQLSGQRLDARAHRVGAQQPGLRAGEVDTDLGHGADRDRVELIGGLRTRGTDLDAVAGDVGEPARGHLRAAGVVHADEQHDRLVAHPSSPTKNLRRSRSVT